MKPRENDHLWGHKKEYAYFQQAIAQNKLHHAWLINGEEGIGKATFVYHLVRLILGNSPAAISRIKAGSHADLLVVGRRLDEKKNRLRSEILIDDIKAVGEFLRLTPAEGGWRIVVIEDADLMNRNAANSLLKLLEEPPKGALLFLITTHPNRLLPTILSRCRKMSLRGLSTEEMEQGLSILAPQLSEIDKNKVIQLAEGSLGKALQLLESGHLNIKDIVENLLNDSFKSKDMYQQADLILQKENGFTLFLNLLTDAIALHIRQAVQTQKKEFGHPMRPISQWIEIWQTLLKWHKEAESFNLDKKQTLISEFNLVSEL
ncbi:DNA polymerase III subunit delta' [Commensalibacter papalotli (ex Botero et al. 2024)]|uniref:Gamma/tau subunits (DnaX) (PDB:1A5T) n=1 Tax=Commensalibacter papalotli (ex Botero et al. 2024) TaxID=2972766 RepID=A0ABN8W1E7_9PROT|nr:DNA polymerase III subunit delta' [Commensalibacter papalotli (ex Botero et al. 2024)]CAI3922801.1 DNA polymerase III [Commensalibacter papalotli (ex Botero et al. 2024)]CAI3929444.1 DNA polymerase III [Commensalibacter papalotli (ex Botero et al. 2024)]